MIAALSLTAVYSAPQIIKKKISMNPSILYVRSRGDPWQESKGSPTPGSLGTDHLGSSATLICVVSTPRH